VEGIRSRPSRLTRARPLATGEKVMTEKEPKATAPPKTHGEKTDKGELTEKELGEVSGGVNPKPPEPPDPCII
jgi:hypothetical protein